MAQRKTTRKTSKRRTVSKSMKKKAAIPRRTRSGTAGRTTNEKSKSVGSEEVTIDRRRASRREDNASSATKTSTAAAPLERRQKVNRRRQIDPTTCERDYTDQEVEFMNALDEYKRKSGRMFPTCSEVLEVIRALGYIKVSVAEATARLDDSSLAVSAKPMPADWSAMPQETTTAANATAEPSLQL